jgi:hypothetical protein
MDMIPKQWFSFVVFFGSTMLLHTHSPLVQACESVSNNPVSVLLLQEVLICSSDTSFI